MIALTFEIKLLEPLLATMLEGDPNSGRSFGYVPGGMIRGALIAAYLRRNYLEDAAGDADFRRLFLDGTTRYLNAYPVPDRMLPAPHAWFVEKGHEKEGPIHDFSVEVDEDKNLKQAVKWADDKFCTLTNDTVEYYSPPRQVKVHTQRDRRKGRATKEKGAVFQYQALERGEKFGGVILADSEEDAQKLETLLKATETEKVALGRSITAGYGLVEISSVKRKLNRREIDISAKIISVGEEIRITLLSDAVVRDTNGQHGSDIAAAVCQIAGWETIEQIGAFKRTTIVGGFNRKWGLPLPQTLAISAGSVFVFTATKDITVEAIARLEAQGIGERRAEGFGRVVVNWHDKAKIDMPTEFKAKEPSSWRGTLSKSSAELVQQMAERMLRRDLDRWVAKRAGEIVRGIEIRNLPRNAQLSRLRLVIRDALMNDAVDLQSVLKYFKGMKKTARDQFARPKVKEERLDKWICKRVEETHRTPQRAFRNVEGRYKPQKIGNQVADLTDELAREYVLRLIDRVLARAMKERNQRGER